MEGFRWQMLPAYGGVILVVLIATLLQGRVARLPRKTAGALCGVVLGIFLAAVALGTVYPVFRLPDPDGPYPVGTAVYHLVDQSRHEIAGAGPRELMIQAWYPAAKAPGIVAPYRERSATDFRSAYLTLIPTHSRKEVPVAARTAHYPVLLFSPSWHGVRNQSTFEMESLASHGFIVIGIDHPYGSSVTVFPDGRVVKALPDAFLDTSSEEALRQSMAVLEKQLRVRTADLKFLLDQLTRANEWDSRGILAGHLDLTRIGAIGYSFGGTVVTEACRTEPRIKAAINLDGMVFGESAAAGIDQPFLMMSDSFDPPPPEELHSRNVTRRRFAEIEREQAGLIHGDFVRHGGYELVLQGFSHENYSDTPLQSPLRRLTGSGEIDPRRGMKIVTAYTIAFFEKWMNHSAEPLIDHPSGEFPEARLITFASPTTLQSLKMSGF